jgi:hypothetical protein
MRKSISRFLLPRFAAVTIVGVVLYVASAYGVAPTFWRHYEHQKGIANLPMTTVTALGIPGDPLNIGLEGSREDILCAMNAAGWSPADPVTLGSSLKIVSSVLLDRPYLDAPVSDLFYEGRREDLAFQKAAGRSASSRHHVRLWKVLDAGDDGEAVWLGSATYDVGVGFSHYTAQVTHHIAPDIDAERDLLSADLAAADKVEAVYETSGVGPTLAGRNGGGDRYETDGEIVFSRLASGCDAHATNPKELENPPAIAAKNHIWRAVAKLFRAAS